MLWATVLFWVSSQTVLPDLPRFEGQDKVVHGLCYAVLTFLLLFGARWPRGHAAWLWGLLAACYGITDELHQSFVPNRVPSLWDLAADAVGSAVVVQLWLMWSRSWLGRGTVAGTQGLPSRQDAQNAKSP